MESSPVSKVFSSSPTSSISDDLYNHSSIDPVKFICSYGGKILPRYPDGKLRYTGGETRIITVDRSISFSELMKKLGEMTCGLRRRVVLRCQIPSLDLDVLVSVTSDEDLRNLFEEYEQVKGKGDQGIKVRAFLDFLPVCPPSVSPIHKSRSSILLSPPANRFGHLHHQGSSSSGGGGGHPHQDGLRRRVYSADKLQYYRQSHHHCQQLANQIF